MNHVQGYGQAARRAFSLIELIAVMVVLAILAGVAAPRFFNYSDQAKESAVEGTLGGVRSAIGNFYANSSLEGTPRYPTLEELVEPGVVMQEAIPENPYNGLTEVREVNSRNDAENRRIASENRFGWNYYYDNDSDPPVAIFWANTSEYTEDLQANNN